MYTVLDTGVVNGHRILERARQGDAKAAEEFLSLVYGELCKLAAAKMSREARTQSLRPTGLVHEAWLRLGGDQHPSWHGRAHFFGSAAEAMRRILIDRARRRLTARRGAGSPYLFLDDLDLPAAAAPEDAQLIALDEALKKFAAVEPRKCELVKLRYFAGMNLRDSAAALNIAVPTAKAMVGLLSRLVNRGNAPERFNRRYPPHA